MSHTDVSLKSRDSVLSLSRLFVFSMCTLA